MRLAIIRRRMASAGGAESFIANASREFAGAGIAVTLVSEGTDGVAEMPGDDWLRVPSARGSRTRRYRAFQDNVRTLLGENRFDVVQAHERIIGADIFRAGDGVHAAWVDRLKRSRSLLRRPLVDLDHYHRLLIRTERAMAANSDTIFVANSRLVMDELAHWLDVPAPRLRLIENGVDLERFRPASAEERRAAQEALGVGARGPVVAFVGSGFERKGAFELVRAMATPDLREAECLVVGRDKRLADLQRLAERLGVAPRVKLLGALGDVRTALHAADLFVLPTLYDPMPNAALEAIACGLPVVTTADAGLAGYVAESGAGAIATREPESIAAASRAVLERGETARARACALRAKFDLAAKTAEWISLYREIA